MLTKTKMQEIQDLKTARLHKKLTLSGTMRRRGASLPSRPTLSKYYDMDVIPDDPGAKLAKTKNL